MRRSMQRGLRRGQQGITLIVGLIMLILITLMVTTAFTLNTSNLRAVGNMQFRNEALAAANKALETVVMSSFTSGFLSVPAAQTINYDMNNDGNADYKVTVTSPTCLQATTVAGTGGSGNCSGTRAGALAGCSTSNYSTLWDMTATVSDVISGANVSVRQGVRIEITQSQRDAVCP